MSNQAQPIARERAMCAQKGKPIMQSAHENQSLFFKSETLDDLKGRKTWEALSSLGMDADDAMERVSDALILYDSHVRPHAFLMLFDYGFTYEQPRLFWEAVHRHWTMFDLIPHDIFAVLFAQMRKFWNASYLEPNDLKFYNSLPEHITIYRGTDEYAEYRDDGLSWTLSKTIAEEFARGHRYIKNPNPIILEAKINKEEIAGAYMSRKEHEIVLFKKPLSFHET